jgi:hypothetical protein
VADSKHPAPAHGADPPWAATCAGGSAGFSGRRHRRRNCGATAGIAPTFGAAATGCDFLACASGSPLPSPRARASDPVATRGRAARGNGGTCFPSPGSVTGDKIRGGLRCLRKTESRGRTGGCHRDGVEADGVASVDRGGKKARSAGGACIPGATTARRGVAAALDFTNVAGKTGTSTGPKDAWFVGFTGKYVAGVWIGNDDNHPMRSGVTGGHQAAPIWHDLMTVAHTDMNIPTIPGLAPHPRQIEEQQRVAELKAAQVASGEAPATAASTSDAKPESVMPDKTRDALKTLVAALRKASGFGDVSPATATPASNSPSSSPPTPGAAPAQTSPAAPGVTLKPSKERAPDRADRRATLLDMSKDDLSMPATQPPPAPAAAPVPRPGSGPQ